MVKFSNVHKKLKQKSTDNNVAYMCAYIFEEYSRSL